MSGTSGAQFAAEGPGAPSTPLPVQFNPASLKLSVTNTIQDDQQPGSQGLQSVRKSATKLEVELVFDSTESGSDVRDATGVLKAMGRPGGTSTPTLPQVTFTWGVFSFRGVIESLQETIDFFSAAGVPLRSTVQVTMQSLELDVVLAGSKGAAAGGGAGAANAGVSVAPPPPPGTGATGTGAQAGAAGAGRAIAAANGLESMRFTAGAGLAVSASVQLSGPVGFSASAGAGASFGASAGAGFSAGAGGGFSASAGARVSASAGLGFSAGAGATAGASFGAGASAGVSATGGAFAGLGVSKSAGASYSLDVDKLRPSVPTFSVSADPSSGFDATGRVVATASAGLRADVNGGAQASATAWIG